MNTNPLQININGVTFEVSVTSIGATSIQLSIDGELYDLPLTPSNPHLNDLSFPRDNTKNQPIINSGSEIYTVRAQMPGKVISIYVQPNQTVSIGQPLCTIEAMKMEQDIISPTNGIIDTINVQPMDVVLSEQLLITFKKP